MKTSNVSSRLATAAELIREAEGLRLTAYLCPNNKLTIGYGHTAGVQEGDTVTKEGAEFYLANDIMQVEDFLQKDLPTYVRLSEGRRAALISFVFNIGGTKFRKSTLRELLMKGAWKQAEAQFNRWIYGDDEDGDGKKDPLPGLIKRRAIETKLWKENP